MNRGLTGLAGCVALRSAIAGAVIVAHEEDSFDLEEVLRAEGISSVVVRGPYTVEQQAFTGVMQALVNHAHAWRIAAGRDRPTIVLEPDFVPVKGFGDLPVPVPAGRLDDSLGYLYAVGPELWDMAGVFLARGHGGGAVALLIAPKVAELLLRFADEELAANVRGAYSAWDSRMGYWLRERGVESYIPYRHYGEHGGVGNPEHAKFGLGRAHRADALQGPLAFVPAYAKGSAVRFWRTRVWARSWGTFRLLRGRLLTWRALRGAADSSRMLRFAVGRLLFRGLPSESGR